MKKIESLYPQYQYSQDRRKQNVPVVYERRSGADRRTSDRVTLDTRLTRDIYEVKGKIKDITGTIGFSSTQNNVNNIAKVNATNGIQTDEFLKSKNLLEQNTPSNNTKSISPKAVQAGLLGLALAGILFTPFIGSVGAVIAASATIYVGTKILKEAIAEQVNNDSEKDKK